MKRYIIFLLICIFSVLISISFNSCKKYEENSMLSLLPAKTRLTGRWRIVELNDVPYSTGQWFFQFNGNGDFIYNGFPPIKGKWKWKEDKKGIIIEFDQSKSESWDIYKLTNNEFWFKPNIHYYYKCEKIK